MIPPVPTDNLYKFCALAGIILCVATLYYAVTIAAQITEQQVSYEAAIKKQIILIDDLKKSTVAGSKEQKLLEVDLEATQTKLRPARIRLIAIFILSGTFSFVGGSLATYGFRNWRVIQQRQDQLLFREPRS